MSATNYQLWAGRALLGQVALPPSRYWHGTDGAVGVAHLSVGPLAPAPAYDAVAPLLAVRHAAGAAGGPGPGLPVTQALEDVVRGLALRLTTLDGAMVESRALELELRQWPEFDGAMVPVISCLLPEADGVHEAAV